MRVDEIDVEEFASGEHRGLTIEDIDGDSLLLKGGNRTGKTLTFNAILYNLLGARETIGLSTGRGNSVDLRFTDGTWFHRGSSGAEYSDGENEYTGQTAKNKLEEKLGDRQVIKNHFVHSHIGKLPLDNSSSSDLIRVIRTVSNRDLEEKIELYDDAVDRLNILVTETEDSHRRAVEGLEDVERQISDVDYQLERHEDLLEKIKSGELQEIIEQLLQEKELEEELQTRFDRKETIRQRLRKLYRQKSKQENYSEEINSVIAEAVNQFVCPTCDRRISTGKAKRRLKQGVCPYCGRDHSLDDLKNSIEEKIDKSDELLEEIENQIEQLEDERSQIKGEIEEIQEERPELAGLDAFTKRKLNQHSNDLESIEADVSEELDSLRENKDGLLAQKESLEEEIGDTENRVSAYKDSLKHASEKLEQLKEQSFSADIQSFADQWEEVYDEISPQSLQIDVTEEGVVRLPGRNSIREYGRGNLSSSEVRLLNISYSICLNRLAVKNGFDWETIVLDEPFSGLDSEIREEALSYIQDSEQQFIILSRNDGPEKFRTEELEQEALQTQISDFL